MIFYLSAIVMNVIVVQKRIKNNDSNNNLRNINNGDVGIYDSR